MNGPAADAPPAHPRLAAPAFVARVRMREAAGADMPALVPMINAAYKPRDGWLFGDHMRVQPDDLRDEFADDRTTGIVATIDGAIAGFAVVRGRASFAEFGLLAVDVEWQGHGLARLIVQRAEAIARDAGRDEMRLSCIRENQLPPFYESLGYAVTAEEHAARWGSLHPFSLVSMAKVLAPTVAKAADAAMAPSLRFRGAIAEEAPELAATINDAYLREAWLLPPPRTTVDELRAAATDANMRLIVAEADGEIAGAVAVWLEAPDGGGPHFGMLAVAPRFQGRGLAPLLVREAERAAVDAGYNVMLLDCAKELGLPPYYASLGYGVVRGDFGMYLGSERPITRVTMMKQLAERG